MVNKVVYIIQLSKLHVVSKHKINEKV